MADKVVVPVVVPVPGQDPEFDQAFEKMWESLQSLGNPEGIPYDVARETLAKRMTEFGGKTWKASQAYDKAWESVPTEAQMNRPPTELRVPTIPTDAYWYDDPVQTKTLEHYILTRRALGNLFHGSLLITGPAGTGKTMGVAKAIERLNERLHLSLRLTKMDCATITDPQKWLGRREVDAQGTHWVQSDFLRAIQEGDVVLLDDITRLHPTLLNMVFSLLDGSQAIHLSDLNVTVPVHPETVFLATANIGAQFGGTHRFDWAMRERFPFTIERGFPPEADEIKVVTSQTGCDPDAAQVLVDIAAKSRDLWQKGDIHSPISTRTLVAAGWLVASGMTEREALEVTAVPLYDADASGATGEKSERMTIRAAIDARIGRRP